MNSMLVKYSQRLNVLNENAVFLILTSPHTHDDEECGIFIDLCDSYQAASKVIDKHLLDYIDDQDEKDVADIDNMIQSNITENVIIKKIGLDKTKPIYIKLTRNYFYSGLTNDFQEWKQFVGDCDVNFQELCARNFYKK